MTVSRKRDACNSIRRCLCCSPTCQMPMQTHDRGRSSIGTKDSTWAYHKDISGPEIAVSVHTQLTHVAASCCRKSNFSIAGVFEEYFLDAHALPLRCRCQLRYFKQTCQAAHKLAHWVDVQHATRCPEDAARCIFCELCSMSLSTQRHLRRCLKAVQALQLIL